MDLPVWQEMYAGFLERNNVELISFAEDSGGERAAGQWFDRGKPTFTQVVDQTHLITSLYSLVNVPSAVWIDEKGMIVRINEGTYVGALGKPNPYQLAVRDWAEHGARSRFVWTKAEVAKHIRVLTPEVALADPTFKLGVYFHEQGDNVLSNKYWEQAQKLDPDNWNFHRQDWSFTREEATGKFREKTQQLQKDGRPYYAPLELEGPERKP